MKRFYILKLIENQMKEYSPREQSVAEYILHHPEKVLEMTTKQLAAASKTSEAAIIRFCKRIGINSFKGLKIEIAKEINISSRNPQLDSPLNFEDDLEMVVNKVVSKTVQALNNTQKLLDVSELEDAVEALSNSERIYLYGAGGSYTVANDLAQKLLRVNLQAFQSPDIHIQTMMVANITERDVLFVVSTSGKTAEILQLLGAAKEKGAKTILLTQHGRSPAKRLSDIVLNISVEEQNVRIGTMSARIAQLAVIDALFIGLCMKLGTQVYERIIDTHKAVQRMKK